MAKLNKGALTSVFSRLGVPMRVLREVRMESHLACVRVKSRVTNSDRFAEYRDIALHFGCGSRMLPGWFNVDGWPADGIDLVADLRQPLPLPAASCAYIFTEHVFEHIDRDSRAIVLSEFRRLLAPSGVLRIVVPDLAAFVDAYRRQDLPWFRTVLGLELNSPAQLADGLNGVFVDHFHRFIDDFASLESALHEAGFDKVEESKLNGSAHETLRIDTTLPSRAWCSLYVEASGTAAHTRDTRERSGLGALQ